MSLIDRAKEKWREVNGVCPVCLNTSSVYCECCSGGFENEPPVHVKYTDPRHRRWILARRIKSYHRRCQPQP